MSEIIKVMEEYEKYFLNAVRLSSEISALKVTTTSCTAKFEDKEKMVMQLEKYFKERLLQDEEAEGLKAYFSQIISAISNTQLSRREKKEISKIIKLRKKQLQEELYFDDSNNEENEVVVEEPVTTSTIPAIEKAIENSMKESSVTETTETDKEESKAKKFFKK